jgi:ABC-type multidrug transport system ATPase subunit/ABC-type multidrug transport system permease subunit
MVGYVDQEDTLMPTLTVEETIMCSALLRLPKNMSDATKRARVQETMVELGIQHIARSRIGDATIRGISGGEKRRVSIACELVTSPSILFLDELTSGLDAFNAHNVVECLVQLARNYKRTIVFSIHQPRSDIFAMFDHLILLAQGECVYSGPAPDAAKHFAQLGHPCPSGYNAADFLIDITVDVPRELIISPRSTASTSKDAASNAAIRGSASSIKHPNGPESPNGISAPGSSYHRPISEDDEEDAYWENQLGPNAGDDRDQLLRYTQHISQLVDFYAQSSLSKTIESAILETRNMNISGSNTGNATTDRGSDPESTTILLERAPLRVQFGILAERNWKNLCRNPYLLLSHFIVSLGVAFLCGCLFWKVTADIAGFQNRMGCFFFICALFGFGSLASLHTLASERLLFVRERANGYYAPVTYFAAKVLTDLLPLRVVPAVLLGAVMYPMVGLVSSWDVYAKFQLVLILFNVTAAALCLMISSAVRDVQVASYIASLSMLFSMLFGGLLLNKESIPAALSWMKHLSFFNFALEALCVNELKKLQLTEERLGMKIDIPAAVILSTFGFDALGFWNDVLKLTSMAVALLGVALLIIHFFVKERR